MQRNNNNKNQNQNKSKKYTIKSGRFQDSISAAVARTLAATKTSDAFIHIADNEDRTSKDATKSSTAEKGNAAKKPIAKRNNQNRRRKATGKSQLDKPAVKDKPIVKPKPIPKKKAIFEIDNSSGSDGLPPILPFEIGNSKPVVSAKKSMVPNEPLDIENASNATIIKEIINALEIESSPMSVDELVSFLVLKDSSKISTMLTNMVASGDLFVTRRKKFALPSQIGYVTGRLQVTTKGYGFLICDDNSEDIFIPENDLKSAMNGDIVIVNVNGKKGDQRSGTVIFIKKRANDKIIGTINIDRNSIFLAPDNDKIKSLLKITAKNSLNAKVNQKVVAEFDYSICPPELVVLEILGDADDAGMDVLSIIKSYGIDIEFSRGVLQSASMVSKSPTESDISGREDLRNAVTFTIDGADAKDFDDAISCEINADGNYLLGVHIADVSHYVLENSSMDKEAQKRCNSVYVIDKVVPMLPEKISNGVCSLQQDETRLTLSCMLEINNGGEIKSHWFTKSVISSKMRMIYDEVSEYYEVSKPENHKLFAFDEQLQNIRTLSQLLKAKRHERGSIDFNISESEIRVDGRGKVVDIEPVERGIANSIIEEFMLACNEVVAEHMSYAEEPMLYRVHEEISEEKQQGIYVFLANLGYNIPKTRAGINPKQLQAVLDTVKGKPDEEAISRFLLRSMQKAKYSAENEGHFGLASEYYCHFTAPIRRYNDLVVHRIVKKLIDGELNATTRKKYGKLLPEVAEACSEKERVAMECERDVIDLKKAEYMANFIGENFAGKVSGVTSFGLFVELENTCEGLIRMSDMQDDYYIFDEKKLSMIGRRTRKEYTIGDSVDIRVENVDVLHRKVDFVLIKPKSSSKARFRRR